MSKRIASFWRVWTDGQCVQHLQQLWRQKTSYWMEKSGLLDRQKIHRWVWEWSCNVLDSDDGSGSTCCAVRTFCLPRSCVCSCCFICVQRNMASALSLSGTSRRGMSRTTTTLTTSLCQSKVQSNIDFLLSEPKQSFLLISFDPNELETKCS